jgi:hypothetical protein
MFENFKTNFHKHVIASKKESKKSYFALRTDWGFDAEQLLRKKRAPTMRAFFSYSKGVGDCAARLMVTCHKEEIDPHSLVTHINQTFNTNYINQNKNSKP